MGKGGFPTPLPRRGMEKPGFPIPRPAAADSCWLRQGARPPGAEPGDHEGPRLPHPRLTGTAAR